MIGPEAMRRIDRWLGAPGCALLTLLRRAGVAAGMRRRGAPGALRRVLFIQLAESGSMVLADPAMRALATRTGARPYGLTFAGNRASFALAATVADGDVCVIRTASLRELLIDALRFLAWVRRHRIDAVVDCELFSRLTAILCLLTGVTSRVGFHRFNGVGLYRGDLYTQPVAFNPHLHMTQNYLLLVEALLGATSPPAPRVPAAALLPRPAVRRIHPSEQAAVRARLAAGQSGPEQASARLVLVNANASAMLPQRRWPEGHFVELVGDILKHFTDVRVLLIGAVEDGACTAAISRQVGDQRCVDVAGWFPLEQLPALFSLSAVMVSNDSGPAHFASVTALPVVVLFGPETPVLFRPLGRATVISAGLACSPCVNVGNQRRTRCGDNQCMKRIPVAEVFAAVRALLEPPPPPLAPMRERGWREAIDA